MSEAAAEVATNSGNTIRKMRDEDDQSVREWIETLAGDSAVRVQIIRKKPTVGPNGESIGGQLETVEERIDEDYLREHWGGGDFQLKIQRPNGKGNYEYFRARTIKLAGEPKMDGRMLIAGGNGNSIAVETAEPLADKAFETMERNMQRAQERADRMEDNLRNSGGLDIAALQAINAPIIAQLESSQRESSRLQTLLYESMGKKPEGDPFRDKLLEKAIDGESSRIDSLRERFMSETRQTKEAQSTEIKMIREQHRDDMKQQDRRHEREIDMMRNSYESQVKSNDVAYGTRTDGLKSETDRLSRELGEARAELATLRSKKDMTLIEKAKEIAEVKDVLGVGADTDDSDKPWYERVLTTVANSEGAARLIGAYTGAGPEEEAPDPQQQMAAQQQQLALQQAQAEQMMPPVGVPFQAPDGNIYVRNPDDSVTQVDPAALRRQKASQTRDRQRAKGGAPQAGPQEVETPEGTQPPTQQEVQLAVDFMQNALASNTEPAQFAATARNLVPEPILAYIQAVGIDVFLNKVARLEPGSPLTMQHGRNFAREVVKHLFGGVNE